MKAWTKYIVAPVEKRMPSESDGAQYFFEQMGGYGAEAGYGSKPEFFDSYLKNDVRLSSFNQFLQLRVAKDDTVLAVASGRCVNEMALLDSVGCDITCSDLDQPPCLDKTRELFGPIKFEIIDVTKDAPPGAFSKMICLSVIFLFDDADLHKFFAFSRDALNPGGTLLLDLSGVTDNIVSRLFHDLFLPLEAALERLLISRKTGKQYRVYRQPHGYRRSFREIMAIASQYGFSPSEPVWEDAYHLDFIRSVTLNRLMKSSTLAFRLISLIGRLTPFVRMAALRRT